MSIGTVIDMAQLNGAVDRPYLRKIKELASRDASYQYLDTICSDEDGRTYALELEQGTCSVVDFGPTKVTSHRQHVVRFDDGLLDTETQNHIQSPPSDARVRIICLSNTRQDDYGIPFILHPEIINLLGCAYDIDPAIFRNFASWNRFFRTTWRALSGNPFIHELQRLSTEVLPIYFPHVPDPRDLPMVWMRITKHLNTNVLVLQYIRGLFDSDLHLQSWKRLSNSDLQSGAQTPIELLHPIFDVFEDIFRKILFHVNQKHQRWLGNSNGNRAEADRMMSDSWRYTRGLIESFEAIVNSIDEFQEHMTLTEAIKEGYNANAKMKRLIQRYRREVAKARVLEQYVRDTIQMNVGSLSLEESRRSIQQANSLGRISILAFIFFPISLVTSFFGMNIKELTGSGASWKYILITATGLSALICLVCGFLWQQAAWRLVEGILELPSLLYDTRYRLYYLWRWLNLVRKNTIRKWRGREGDDE